MKNNQQNRLYDLYADKELKIMNEYKITSYTEQTLDNRTLQPKGNKRIKYCIYKKVFPFPNKTIFVWEAVKDNFKSEKEAEQFLKTLTR